VNTIPVGKTIAFAYQFTLENLGAIIGLIWLPTVAITVGGFFADTTYSATVNTAMQEGRSAAAGQAVMGLLAWYLLSILLSAMAATAVTRQALGLRKGPAFISFSLGLPEFRVFGAMLSLIAVLLLLLLPYLFTVSSVALAAQAGGAGTAVLSLAALALALAGAGGILYVLARLSFLMLPATVAENVSGLARSWALTRGNFWRIAGVGACTLGPILVIMGVGEYVILGPEFFLAGLNTTLTAAQQTKIAMEQQHTMIQHLPMLLGLSLLIAPFYFGLMLAPAAYAYRALTEANPAV
jgi:hypothetical protein